MRISAALLVLFITTLLRAAPVETLGEHKGAVTALAFSPNGDRLLSVAEDGWAVVWDVKTRKVVHRCLHKDETLFAVAWRPDGSQFATAGESGVVRVWGIGGKKPSAEYKGHIGPVSALAFRPDGELLASGGYLRTIRFWPRGAGNCSPIQDMDGRVTSLAFTDDGQRLVVGTAELTEQRINDEPSNRYGEAGFVRVYDVRNEWSGELIRKLGVRGSQVAVAGDRVLAVGIVASLKEVVEDGEQQLHTNGGGILSIANLKTGKTIASATGAGFSAAWSKDGAVVVCGGGCYRHYSGNIMFGPGDGKAGGSDFVMRLKEGDRITTVAIDPRERRSCNIVGGGWPALALRDAITLKKGVVVDQQELESVAISPDGKLIAVGGANGVIRLHPTAEINR